MKTGILLIALLVGVFLAGCSSNTDGYTSYNQPQGQGQQQPYVGGGCGVAPSSDYQVPESLDSAAGL